MDIATEIDDETIVNVGIVESVCNISITPQFQCANSGDLDSRSIVYASSRMSDHFRDTKTNRSAYKTMAKL